MYTRMQYTYIATCMYRYAHMHLPSYVPICRPTYQPTYMHTYIQEKYEQLSSSSQQQITRILQDCDTLRVEIQALREEKKLSEAREQHTIGQAHQRQAAAEELMTALQAKMKRAGEEHGSVVSLLEERVKRLEGERGRDKEKMDRLREDREASHHLVFLDREKIMSERDERDGDHSADNKISVSASGRTKEHGDEGKGHGRQRSEGRTKEQERERKQAETRLSAELARLQALTQDLRLQLQDEQELHRAKLKTMERELTQKQTQKQTPKQTPKQTQKLTGCVDGEQTGGLSEEKTGRADYEEQLAVLGRDHQSQLRAVKTMYESHAQKDSDEYERKLNAVKSSYEAQMEEASQRMQERTQTQTQAEARRSEEEAARYARAQRAVQEQKEKLEAALQALKAEQERCAVLVQKHGVAETRCAALDDELTGLRKEYDQMAASSQNLLRKTERVQKQQKDNEKEREDREKARERQSERESEEEKRKRKRIQDLVAVLKEENEAQGSEIKTLSARVQDCDRQINTLMERIKQKNKRVKEMEAALHAQQQLEQQLLSSQQGVEEEWLAEKKKLDVLCEELRGAKQKLQMEKEKLQTELEVLEEEFREQVQRRQRAAVGEREGLQEAARAEAGQKKTGEQLASLQHELKEMTAILEMEMTKSLETEGLLQRSLAEASALKKQASEGKAEMETLKQTIADFERSHTGAPHTSTGTQVNARGSKHGSGGGATSGKAPLPQTPRDGRVLAMHRLAEMKQSGQELGEYLAGLINQYEQQIYTLQRENNDLLSLKEIDKLQHEEKMGLLRRRFKRKMTEFQQTAQFLGHEGGSVDDPADHDSDDDHGDNDAVFGEGRTTSGRGSRVRSTIDSLIQPRGSGQDSQDSKDSNGSNDSNDSNGSSSSRSGATSCPPHGVRVSSSSTAARDNDGGSGDSSSTRRNRGEGQPDPPAYDGSSSSSFSSSLSSSLSPSSLSSSSPSVGAWNCGACTYKNEGSRLKCGMCGGTKFR